MNVNLILKIHIMFNTESRMWLLNAVFTYESNLIKSTLTVSHTARMVTQVFLWSMLLAGGSCTEGGESQTKTNKTNKRGFNRNRMGEVRKLLLISEFNCFLVNLCPSRRKKIKIITHWNTPILILHKPKPFGWPWSRSSFFAITRWRRSRATALLAPLGGRGRTRAWVRSFPWGWRPPVGPGAGSLLIKK